MSIVSEVYQVARGNEVELSLLASIEQRKQAEQEIFDKVNDLGKLEIIDLIAMMVPTAIAPLKEPEYFGQIFGGSASLSHAEVFKKIDLPEFADIQRIIHTVFGLNENQKFLISLKEDKNSPAGFSIKKLLLLIDSEQFKKDRLEEMDRLLATAGIPEGYSVSVLFDSTLDYDPEHPRYQQELTSNLLNTFVLTSLASLNPTVFKGEFNYKISGQTGRSTYFPDEGEVLFELTQASVAPAAWFDVFDKVDLEDFDLNTELTNQINANLALLATV